MKVVLDTNVLVSAQLNPYGNPAAVVTLVLEEKIMLCYDNRIMIEYVEVLSRPVFGFERGEIHALLDYLGEIGSSVIAPRIAAAVKDPGDLPFLEVAAASGADFLITGNIKHFPKKFAGTTTVTPADFITALFSGS